MCGVNFILDKKGQLTDNQAIQWMNQALHHRGPDAASFIQLPFFQSRLFFGNTRLKIIDLGQFAQQPQVSDNQTYALVYNGEIYNHKTLCQDLPATFQARGHSDTEALFSYLRYHCQEGKRLDWSQVLDTLNGMYAFVFADLGKGEILIAQDPSQIKPLYFFENEHYFLVSSEIKALLASGLVPKKFNAAQIPHYLFLRHCLNPQTFYQNIFALMKPIRLFFDQKNHWRKQKDIPRPKINEPASKPFDLNEWEQLLKKVLEDQLMGDVAGGLFLSGGVDSSLLLAYIRALGKKHFPVFSLIYPAKDRSFGSEDSHFAHLAAQKYGAAYHPVEIRADQMFELDDFIHRLDQPIADPAAWLTEILARDAGKAVKFVLSGLGADELFAGYNRHKAYYYYLKHPFPRYLLLLARSLRLQFPEGIEHPWRKKTRLWNKLIRQVDRNEWQTWEAFYGLAFPKPRIYKMYPSTSRKSINKRLKAALLFDQQFFLAQNVLRSSDQMSMQHSLELRVPYLDQRLVRQVNAIASEQLFQPEPKWILKKLLRQEGGEVFVKRKKEGFGFPFGKWIKEKRFHFYLDALSKDSPIHAFLPPSAINKYVKAHLRHQRDYSQELWALIILQGWIKKEFG